MNEVSERNSAKLNPERQEKRLQKWKEHFKNLLGNSQKSFKNSLKKWLITN